MYFFNYKEVVTAVPDKSKGTFYKTVRNLCNFYEEKYLGDDEILKELTKIRKVVKKPKCRPDIYTPTDTELYEQLSLIKSKNVDVHQFYLGLMYSGVRIREFLYYLAEPSKFRIIKKDRFKKVLLNYTRNTKSCIYIYLPLDYVEPKVSLKQLESFLGCNKEILRPKYLRNWFYSKCLQLGIPSGVADFYQGRSPVSIGDRHYLDKERMADEKYKELKLAYSLAIEKI